MLLKGSSLMIVKKWTVGSYFTNCYLVECGETKQAIIVDPGFDSNSEAKAILEEIREKGLHVNYIVNTHGHPDHTSGNKRMKKETEAPILIHKQDAPMLNQLPPADQLLEDEDIIKFGHVTLQVLHTPGHTRGGICLLGEDAVFTGDTLFAGSIGRTDFPGGSYKQIMRSIQEKLVVLPDHLIVYPGHGPKSTISKEKRNNPFMKSVFK